MTWAFIEPEQGRFNEAYLDCVQGILDRCAERGIYVFLSVHQDLYADFGVGAGDGAPLWAAITDGRKARKPQVIWAEGYFFGKATQRAFDNFWANAAIDENGGILDYYARMWKHLAQRFKDHPALFGFELLNEPFPGTPGGKVFRKLISKLVQVLLFDKQVKRLRAIADLCNKEKRRYILDYLTPDVLTKVAEAPADLIREFDLERYGPFLNKIAGAIREVTDNGIIMMENSYYSNLSIPFLTPAIHYDGVREEKLCYAPHAYDFLVDSEIYKYASDERAAAMFAQARRNQERLGIPVIVGEWGGSDRYKKCPVRHFSFLLDLFDQYKWSHTYWACRGEKFFDNEDMMQVLSRPYPRAVTGGIINYSYDREQKIFTLGYDQDRDYDAETIIYLPSDPVSVEAPCAYSIKKYAEGEAGWLELKTPVGRNMIKIQF
jgi:endoglycosylceramidase